MSTIMCSQRMWRLVRKWKSMPSVEATNGAILRRWAATVCSEDGRKLVIAVEASTYLTIVFPFATASEFHDSCAGALAVLLQDIGVPAERISIEVAAMLSAPLSRLPSGDLRKALETMEFVCGIELGYHTDLRIVQANLNEFPHAPPPHYVAVHDARRAFGLPDRDPLLDYRHE
jgi:uncharacterized protein DUF6933